MNEQEFANDHDALITLVGEVRQLRFDIQDLKDTYKAQLIDHETRIRSQEQWRWLIVGAFSFAFSVLTLYVTYFAHR